MVCRAAGIQTQAPRLQSGRWEPPCAPRLEQNPQHALQRASRRGTAGVSPAGAGVCTAGGVAASLVAACQEQPHAVTIKNGSRLCQMSPGGQITPGQPLLSRGTDWWLSSELDDPEWPSPVSTAPRVRGTPGRERLDPGTRVTQKKLA